MHKRMKGEEGNRYGNSHLSANSFIVCVRARGGWEKEETERGEETKGTHTEPSLTNSTSLWRACGRIAFHTKRRRKKGEKREKRLVETYDSNNNSLSHTHTLHTTDKDTRELASTLPEKKEEEEEEERGERGENVYLVLTHTPIPLGVTRTSSLPMQKNN